MKSIILRPRHSFHVLREELSNLNIDLEGRDILIGFNEPAERATKQGDTISYPLNARLPSYFLPAVDVARSQKNRPQFYIVSGVTVALKWSASSHEERLRMITHNKIKFDFLQHFFENFFPETFSMIEYHVSQDPLRVSDEKFLEIWNVIENLHPEKSIEIKKTLARFKHPGRFNTSTQQEGEIERYLSENKEELLDGIKYAISHLFACGDVNFDGDYYINPKGFASIGGHQEVHFNEVRNLAFEVVEKYGQKFFDVPTQLRNNLQIIIDKHENNPPPYSGATKGRSSERELDEATYENARGIDYYDSRPKLQSDMDYIYKHVPKEKYAAFWEQYRTRYNDLKSRYEEAYKVEL
jgi:hypothetical protein